MELPRNRFKQGLAEGKPQIGLWSTICSNVVAEMVAHLGFDWVLIDAEHSPNDVPNIMSQLQALEGGTATGIVRPAWNDMVMHKRLLDIGAQTLLIPFVQNADEARAAVKATRYPPHGVRGVATTTRASRYGRVKDYLAKANSEICVLVQVETKQALDNLEAIADVEGVDGVFIGPSDLAAGLGHLGNPMHPDVQAAIFGGLKRLQKKKKPAGFLSPNVELAKKCVNEGFGFVAVGSDASLVIKGAENLVAMFKA